MSTAPIPSEHEFEGLDDHNRSELLRWVYREQLRRHKEGGRRPDR